MYCDANSRLFPIKNNIVWEKEDFIENPPFCIDNIGYIPAE